MEEKSIRVLIVEDEMSIAQAVRHIVGKYFSCETIVVSKDGVAANEVLMSEDFNIIISDWNMPGMNGDELLVAVRNSERHKDVPFLFLTARNDKDSIIAAIQAGTSDYIVKPFKQIDLRNKISELLKRSLSKKNET